MYIMPFLRLLVNITALQSQTITDNCAPAWRNVHQPELLHDEHPNNGVVTITDGELPSRIGYELEG